MMLKSALEGLAESFREDDELRKTLEDDLLVPALTYLQGLLQAKYTHLVWWSQTLAFAILLQTIILLYLLAASVR